jgi:hypothetical protein
MCHHETASDQITKPDSQPVLSTLSFLLLQLELPLHPRDNRRGLPLDFLLRNVEARLDDFQRTTNNNKITETHM